MDLQDIYRTNPKPLIAAVVAFVVVIVVALILLLGGGSGTAPKGPGAQATAPGSHSPAPKAATVTVPNPSYHPSYVTHFTPSSVDQRIGNEFAASPDNTAALEAVEPAKPGWTAAFPTGARRGHDE